MLFKMNLFIFSRSLAILTSLLNNSAGLASRHTGDQSPKGVFFMADCKGALNRASLKQGSNEPLHPLKVSNERGFWGIERYAVPV